VGAGWTEIFPVYKVDQPPGQSRYTLTGTEFHFWLFNNDVSTFPGGTSGPRSELHIINSYTTGQAQYQADIKIDQQLLARLDHADLRGSSSSTGFMAWAMSNSLNHYSNEVIASPIHDRWFPAERHARHGHRAVRGVHRRPAEGRLPGPRAREATTSSAAFTIRAA
jgi:hypothetical protein